MQLKPTLSKSFSIAIFALLVGCDNSSDLKITSENIQSSDKAALDPELFLQDALIKDITTESCTLSSGIETTCYSITIAGTPANAAIGPFCPRNITDTAEAGGIWFDGSGEVHDIDGDFIKNLPNLYNDEYWQLYDAETGLVNVTDSETACRAAARPDVEEQYQNHCVECSLDYIGGAVSQTFLIPVNPIKLDRPAAIRGDVGISLNGVVLAVAAPVHAILGAYTIAAFDDCGGHVNPNDGYHYHAATDCAETDTSNDGHAPLIAYARDGYSIYAMANSKGEEHTDLDECRGATDEVRGYHYHAASAAENMFIGCFSGDSVKVDGRRGGPPPGDGPKGDRPPPPPRD